MSESAEAAPAVAVQAELAEAAALPGASPAQDPAAAPMSRPVVTGESSALPPYEAAPDPGAGTSASTGKDGPAPGAGSSRGEGGYESEGDDSHSKRSASSMMRSLGGSVRRSISGASGSAAERRASATGGGSFQTKIGSKNTYERTQERAAAQAILKLASKQPGYAACGRRQSTFGMGIIPSGVDAEQLKSLSQSFTARSRRGSSETNLQQVPARAFRRLSNIGMGLLGQKPKVVAVAPEPPAESKEDTPEKPLKKKMSARFAVEEVVHEDMDELPPPPDPFAPYQHIESYQYVGEDSKVHLDMRTSYGGNFHTRLEIASIALLVAIGATLGIIAVLMLATVGSLHEGKVDLVQRTFWPDADQRAAAGSTSDVDLEAPKASSSDVFRAYWAFLGVNMSLVLGAALLTYQAPLAAGSGLPQIKALLNGCHMPGVTQLHTLVCKVIGTTLIVASGLPLGKEGPMVHIGAAVAGNLSAGEHLNKLLFAAGRVLCFHTNNSVSLFVLAGNV
jgi:hypothetical protein